MNERLSDTLIDYILDELDKNSLCEKYAGFDGIIVNLIRNSKVIVATERDSEIDYFLMSMNFIERDGQSPLGKILKYRFNREMLPAHQGFAAYRKDCIKGIEVEIEQCMREVRSLQHEKEALENLN